MVFMFGCWTVHTSNSLPNDLCIGFDFNAFNSVMNFVEWSLCLLTLADHKVNLLFKLSMGLKLFMGIEHTRYGISRVSIQSNWTLSCRIVYLWLLCMVAIAYGADIHLTRQRPHIYWTNVRFQYYWIFISNSSRCVCSVFLPILFQFCYFFLFRHSFAFCFCFFLYIIL